jgi:hypothetical protein
MSLSGCRIDKAQQDLGSNHKDTVGSAVGGDYRRVSGQSGRPAAAAAAQRQVPNSYLLDSPAVAEDKGMLDLEASWTYLLWEGLQQLEADVSRKRAAAATYKGMGAFNKAHKDILSGPHCCPEVPWHTVPALPANAHQRGGQRRLRAAA